jgi:starch synthase
MKIVYVATEATPFVKTGGLADVMGALPYFVAKKENDVCLILPYYKAIRDKWKYELKFVTSTIVTVGWRKQYAGVLQLKHNEVTVYFIDNEFYFGSDYIYGYNEYEAERFAFFSRAVLDAVRLLDLKPDVLHVNDWQTSMIPLMLKEQYMYKPEYNGYYDGIKTVLTIHNLKYQGIFESSVLPDMFSLSSNYASMDKLEFFGKINFLKSGLIYSDRITTVSKTYKNEIRDPFFGENLEGVINIRYHDIYGILNGLDDDIYDPVKDKDIYEKYSSSKIEGKKINKARLQRELNLNISDNIPLIGMISRLVASKGYDLVERVLDDIMSFNVQMVILGTGEDRYENFFQYAQNRYPGRISALIKFDDEMARKIYAGSDMFLMPSLFEPCGISQLIALKYGSVPIVRSTGGLNDTVIPYNAEKDKGTGFVFQNYNAHEMAHTLYTACELYKDKEKWTKLMIRGMKANFSWKKSAEEYIMVYENLIK